ncbi:MAG: UDP-N-acetylglucosamine 1-carboxyvinyltransferase [Patescibacteria group bacterium]
MEDAFIIRGGKKLHGTVTLSGAKNVALKAVIAALLFDGPVVLKNIPRIGDIDELLHLIRILGAYAEFTGVNTVSIDGRNLQENKLDFLHASKIRASFLLFAPLLYKLKHAFIPNPGGCRIGARPIDRIVSGMKSLGIAVSYQTETGYYEARMVGKPEGSFTFKKPSHTGTELMIMLSVFCKGTVVIRNCALEPEIDDLISFLNEGGGKIVRKENDIFIEGVSSLRQKQSFSIVSDRNEAITYAILGIITHGDVTVFSIPDYYIGTFVDFVRKMGAGAEKTKQGGWRFYYKRSLKPIDIVTGTHPGFMTDWQPNMAVLLTQANGMSFIHERVFENRFSYVDELVKVGAKIDLVKPEIENAAAFYLFNYDQTKEYLQAIRVYGPQRLHSGVMKISDLRAGATLAIAALVAEGESVINGASILERGYENFIEKVRGLGGDIQRA